MLVTDMAVARLVPHARNPLNNAKAIDAVKASIAEFGFRHARLEDLAKAKGVATSYVSRILRLTLLAPEMIEAILRRQPAELQPG